MAPVVVAALISAGVQAAKMAGDAYAKNKASKASQEAISHQQDKETLLNNWYDKNANQPATARADAQYLLNYTAEQIRQRNKKASATAAVTGATTESVQAEKEANSKALAEAASQIAAAGANRKDQVEQSYLQGMLGQKDKMSEIENNRANNIAGAGSALGGLNIDVGSIVKAFADSGSSE